MSLELTPFLESLANLLVAVTILLMWRQLSEMAKQSKSLDATTQATAYQEMIASHTESRSTFLLPYPTVLRWHLQSRGFESGSEDEDRIRLYILVKLDLHEAMFLRHKEGSLTEEPWTAWRNVLFTDFGLEEYVDVWTHVRQFYAPSFAEYVDQEVLPKEGRRTHEPWPPHWS